MITTSTKAVQFAFTATFALVQLAISVEAAETLTPERFKSFVNSPPIISNLVYVVEEHVLAGPPPSQLVKRRETSYQVTRQTNASLIAVLTKPPNGPVPANEKPSRIIGRYEKLYWDLAYRGTHYDLNFWQDEGKGGVENNNEPFAVNRTYEMYLSEMLSLGIGNVQLSTLVWRNSTFTADGSPFDPRMKSAFTGELKSSPDGLTVSVERSVSGGPRIRSRVEYEYGEPLSLPYMPRRIVASDLDADGRPLRQRIYRIQELVVANNPLPKEAFLPSSGMYSNAKLLTSYYTNGARFFLRNGKLEFVRKLEAPLNAQNQRRTTYFKYVYPLALCLFALLVWGVIRQRNKQTSNTGE